MKKKKKTRISRGGTGLMKEVFVVLMVGCRTPKICMNSLISLQPG